MPVMIMAGLLAMAGTDPQAPPPQSSPPPTQLKDVDVVGRRGAARVDPQVELGAASIDALHADNIGEVIRRAAQDYGLGDTPLVIINGRRVADPGVFTNFPSDALVRLEVLPPEAGAIYGAGNPSRRVVNIVLERHFESHDARTALRRPSAGGMSHVEGEVSRSSIQDGRASSLGLQVVVDTALHARSRNQAVGDGPEAGAVTLRSPSETVVVSLAQTRMFGDWSASLNANAQAQEMRSVSLSGAETLASRRRSQSLIMTGGLDGDVAGWSVQSALNGNLTYGQQSGLSASDTRQEALGANLLFNRSLFDLPTGTVSALLSMDTAWSRSTVAGPSEARRTVSGRSGNLNGNLTIPLLQTMPGIGGSARGLGDLMLNLGANLGRTDAGRGDGLDAGLLWSPSPKVQINGSWSAATRSPPNEQRFDAQYYGEPTRVFDLVKGEAVDVRPILGGNPDLRPPRSDQVSLSAWAGPFTALQLQGGVSYENSREVDGIGDLPDPTPEVEAAFPIRFRRGADGRLIGIDKRPINFASSRTETLSTNLSASFPLGAAKEGANPDMLRVVLNHSWPLKNVTTLSAGLPEMDRLAGDGGGLPRQQFGLSVDLQKGRWGLNAETRWRDGYRMRRKSGQDSPEDLRISAFSTVDLKLTRQLQGKPAALDEGEERRGAGLQLELEVANLFDARPHARLGDGRPAPGYGRDDQDPVGRTILVGLKRRF